jgi:TetR/AcrR family transcriptional regulator, transcriptional repressor of bet genes
MPRPTMMPVRRKALIEATLTAIGERGSLDVTMSDIAGRAGVSPALAHHYFGGKDDLLEATMRHLLRVLRRETVTALSRAETPRARLSAIVAVNFSASQFQPGIVAAWLAFYVEAQRSETLRRLLRVYARRLHANLLGTLSRMLPRHDAVQAAEAVAAMIDGFYIRRALKDGEPDPASAVAVIEDYLALKLGSIG